jgi:hypothetical protein
MGNLSSSAPAQNQTESQGRILTLPPFGVPGLRGFLDHGRPDRLKAELRTGQGLGLRWGQGQDALESHLDEIPGSRLDAISLDFF